MARETIGLLSLLATLACYWANKRWFRRHPHPLLMPIVATPAVLIWLTQLAHVSYPQYIAQTHWLVWLLGPATVAFALPLHAQRQLLVKHWMSIATGVLVASAVSISTSVWFAQAIGLPDMLQRGLAVRSVTTPFAIEAGRTLGGSTDLVSLFVLLTGISGMLMGEIVLRVRSKLAARPIAPALPRRVSSARCRPWWPRW